MRVATRWRNARSCVTNTTAPRIVDEERLEPGHRLDVEMVGRLVEQQHVGLRHQRARQQHAAPPAAGQRVDTIASAGRPSRDSHHVDA